MIVQNLNRCHKAIACLFASLFYISLLLPLAGYGRSVSPHRAETKGGWLPGKPALLPVSTVTPVRQPQPTAVMPNKTEQPKQPLNTVQKTGGGPGQPEMQSFESVGNKNMVDLFSGDFTYNIPLMDVGGYPVNIHYNSGITMDQEASWVGLGWNINPGTISRNMRGLPDDFNGTELVTREQNMRVNRTVGLQITAQAEIVGAPISAGVGMGVFKNTYNGWGLEQFTNAAITISGKTKGNLNNGLELGLGLGNNSQTGLDINPSISRKQSLKEASDKGNAGDLMSSVGIGAHYNTRVGLTALSAGVFNQKLLIRNRHMAMSGNSALSFANNAVTPTINMPTHGRNFSFHVKVGGEIVALHPNGFVEGYVQEQYIEEKEKKMQAYGYLYFTEAEGQPNALLDYNREKELQFSYGNTPHIALPQYTYDVYSIAGEGTGGTIRPYRGDIGHVRDHQVMSTNADDGFGAEIGFGQTAHTGVTYDGIRSFTKNQDWTAGNAITKKLPFQKKDGLYQPVYFRNPTEKTSNTQAYYNLIGGDTLLRVALDRSNIGSVGTRNEWIKYVNGYKAGTVPVNQNIVKAARDKREQVVSYLTAAEASAFGLDKNIRSYAENVLPLGDCTDAIETVARVDGSTRLAHHLSEISVLNGDGRRYVYGLPAYNLKQRDVSFSVDREEDAGDIEKGLVDYQAGVENSVDNKKGKDHYFSAENMPAYAHSFLLTGILSPDYVDVGGDGITADDLGDAVRFNYTRVYGQTPATGFGWRFPLAANKASYSEGAKSYSRDDRGSYQFGTKEVWYTHSIESKTMVAVFRISADRLDSYSVDENGNRNTDTRLRKLDRIDLYAKADLQKNNAAARPVKTVHFEYSYELCKGVNGDPAQGKLTLKRIWFSYNKNEKGKQNPYVFQYKHANPNYHPKQFDRWGNYKDKAGNPGGLNNADYPYASQDAATANAQAAAWHLSGVNLPSGGSIRVQYEADDYAYVQDKRAAQLFTLAGFGDNPTATPGNMIYQGHSANYKENEYIFFNSTVPVNSNAEFFEKYLAGIEYVYLKIAVQMPADRWGAGYDFVPLYGKIAGYGVVSGSQRCWIRLEKVKDMAPVVRSAFQYLRLNLPSKAYPGSEADDDPNLKDAVSAMVSSFNEIKNAIEGFEKTGKQRNWCRQADPAKSFIRLNTPSYSKKGGGQRVKRIDIYDNWNAMTQQKEAVYGQEYQYQTSIKVNGQDQVISSGVASYEPMIGGEENPFRQPIPYSERVAPMGPVSLLFSEMPLAESFFPARRSGTAGCGYAPPAGKPGRPMAGRKPAFIPAAISRPSWSILPYMTAMRRAASSRHTIFSGW